MGNKYAISILFASKMNMKKLSGSKSSLAHEKGEKLQAPQNPWKHDKVIANKLGQRTDFPGPIIAENLLKKLPA